MCEILKVFYVFFTLIVFLSRTIWSLSCFILINSVLTMHLAFRIVIQCQKLVGEKLFDLKENSGKSQGKVREFHLENFVRTLWNSVSITNANMLNSAMMFIFLYFRLEVLFLSIYGPESQNFLLKMKLHT